MLQDQSCRKAQFGHSHPLGHLKFRSASDGFRRVGDSGEQSSSQGKCSNSWAQMYLHEHFGLGQAHVSEASPLIVPASCRHACVAKWPPSTQTGFFLGDTKPKDVFK